MATTEEGATPALSFDPTDGTLSPWIWLTLTTLILCCLLFISFRRAKSIELYHKGIEYLKSKLPSSLPFTNSSRGIHLATPSSTTSLSSSRSRPPNLPRSTSFSSDSSSDEPLLNTDELPLYSNSSTTPTSLRIASFQRRGQSMFESFSEQLVEGSRRVIGGLGWGEGGGGAGGVKRMLLGSRDVDKGMGRIRLGEERGSAEFELGDEDVAIEDAVEIPSTNRYT